MDGIASAGVRRRRVPGGRGARVVVRFTAAERRAVAQRAAVAGLSAPAFLALSALRPEGISVADVRSALTGLDAARRVLAGVANNVNQLTARLHSTGVPDPALPGVLAAVGQVLARVDAAASEISAVVGGRRS